MTTEAQGEERPPRASRARRALAGGLAIGVLAVLVAWLYATAVIAYVLLSDWCRDRGSTCPATSGDVVLGIALIAVATVGSAATGIGAARLLRHRRGPGARWSLALAVAAAALWVVMLVAGFGL